jgi:hypothetical protein
VTPNPEVNRAPLYQREDIRTRWVPEDHTRPGGRGRYYVHPDDFQSAEKQRDEWEIQARVAQKERDDALAARDEALARVEEQDAELLRMEQERHEAVMRATQAEAALEERTRALLKYGGHSPAVGKNCDGFGGCKCGWSELYAALQSERSPDG